MEQDEMREILEEFFTEAGEGLDRMEGGLLALEDAAQGGKTDSGVVDEVFRVLHTLKGGAGFLGLEKMAKLAHAGENLLDEVRCGKVAVTKPVMDALLATNDSLKELLECYRVDEGVDGIDYTALVAVLEKLATGAIVTLADVAPTAPINVSEPAAAPAAPVDAGLDPSLINQELLAEVTGDETLDPSRDPDAPSQAAPQIEAGIDPSLINQELLAEVTGDETLDPSRDPDAPQPASQPASPVPAPVAPVEVGIDPSLINQELLAEVTGDETLDPSRDKGDDTPPTAAPAVAAPIMRGDVPVERRQENRQESQGDRRDPQADRRQAGGRRAADAGQETIRVEVERLDKVMNLVGELVLARNSLVRQISSPALRNMMEKTEEAALVQASIEELSRVTQDIQMSVLSTRMQPIKKVFDKIPRQVRELKTQLSKEVDLIVEGEMTEVDKSLVEELSDPMVHMVRNALDHGIETPDEREMVGKHRTGTLVIRAFYEGNNVVVQVQEDGKGIDPQKIKNVAIKKGVITETQAATMSDADAVRLIMAPGFSTAEIISDVSGRGVGMDVVNSKIQALKGTVDITSEVNVGTTFSIYMPLTLAIVQALVVASNKEGFAVPIGDISEVIKFAPDSIHRMSESDVIELRGEALPLFYLSQLTKKGFIVPPRGVKPTPQDAAEAPDADTALADAGTVTGKKMPKDATATKGFVVVVRDGTNSMGLVVDELIGQEEAVVKPVTDMFEFNSAVSGATITGDGSVHMILDIPFMLKTMARNAAAKKVKRV